ncbi:MAG TPA: hypothetical protein VKR57_07475 [Terriglobales bacterium]|nr:hypothetical protein [Terriglobales bacterium]
MLLDLVPFLVFGGVFLIAFFVFCHFAKKTRSAGTIPDARSAVDLESPVVSPEASIHPELDPQLASVLIYPGAVPIRKTVAEGEGGRRRSELSVTYWTPDPIETVWEHYRRELPDWAETLSQDSRELIYRTDHHACLIRVYDQDGRTLIDATVKPAQYNRNNLFSRN